VSILQIADTSDKYRRLYDALLAEDARKAEAERQAKLAEALAAWVALKARVIEFVPEECRADWYVGHPAEHDYAGDDRCTWANGCEAVLRPKFEEHYGEYAWLTRLHCRVDGAFLNLRAHYGGDTTLYPRGVGADAKNLEEFVRLVGGMLAEVDKRSGHASDGAA
jgi:hypothetical protein